MAPKPSPPSNGPLGCNHKKRYTSVATALDVLKALGDEYLQIYYCPLHYALHHGHERLGRKFQTWDAAMQAARDIQARQRQPRRMSVKKSGRANRPWELEWSRQP